MPEEIEIETKDLQDTIEELQEERRERAEEQRQNAWTRYIALATAVLAVFAAIAALQSGSLINESMMDQLKASDTWNQYQASRLKDHLYTLQAHQLLDRGANAPLLAGTPKHIVNSKAGESLKGPAAEAPGARAVPPHGPSGERQEWTGLSPQARLRQYIQQAEKEREKEADLTQEAQKLERESARKAEVHHEFARSVALIQVAISLAAVAALTRMKSVWWLSLILGVVGLAFFGVGWWAMTVSR